MSARKRLAAAAVAVAALGMPAGAQAFDLGVELRNYAKTLERQALYTSAEGQVLLRAVSLRNQLEALRTQLDDPERQFVTHLCWAGMDGCAGDARLYDWQTRGYGIVEPVLFTARNGATLSGHVWATRSGPAKRPGVVITNGSVQANEQLYWFAAQALAKAGYVVLTWDPQGQGQSDTFGAAPDEREGFPAQSDGRPFFDGSEDALNFFLSTPSHPYVPERSCSSGTSHAAKQERRVAEGRNAAHNPFWELLDSGRIGMAGHSYGAAGISYVGQRDPRVDAIVAWDNLSQPSPGEPGSFPPGTEGCPADPSERVNLLETRGPGEGKPALGMAADYFLPPTPQLSDPPSEEHCDEVSRAFEDGVKPSQEDGSNCKSLASKGYSRRGIDTGELVIRGGSHLDFSFISNPAFGASLRGADLIGWYTTAWFDKYVKGDPTADARLLTDRWRHDGTGASVDPDGDGNLFSFYHRSRLDFRRADGTKITCEDLRSGCPELVGDDGYRGDYSYIALARSPDGASAPGAPQGSGIHRGAGAPRPACTSRRTVSIRLGRVRGARVTRVTAKVGRKVVGRSRGRRITVRLRGLPKGVVSVRLRVTVRRGARTWTVSTTRRYRTCARR